MLDIYQQSSADGHIRAIRRLSMVFKPDMLQSEPSKVERLIHMVSSFIEANRENETFLSLGLTLAAKIGQEDLLRLVESFVNDKNITIGRLARDLCQFEAPTLTGSIRSIFVLDDSKLITRQLEKSLLDAGYLVQAEIHVRNGFEGLKRNTFDLLILDLNMPEMSGLDFLRKAREVEIAPEKVLVLASNRSTEELGGIIAAGISGVSLKPFNMNDILTKISELSGA